MHPIDELQHIVREHTFDNEQNLIIQLEIMRNIDVPEVRIILEKVLEHARTEPQVIDSFVDGFQRASTKFITGGYMQSGSDGFKRFIEDQQK